MHSESDELWKPCPPGTFARIASSIKKRRIRRRVMLTSATAVVLVSAGVLAWSVTNKNVEYHYGGIWCSEVRQLALGYLGGKLDAERTARIKTHLAHCPICPPLMAEMQKVTWVPCPHRHEPAAGCACHSRSLAANHEQHEAVGSFPYRNPAKEPLIAASLEATNVWSR